MGERAKIMNLIIVESPTKAKTLSTFLGSSYRVVSTMGHIRDLPEKKLGIEIIKTPNYEFSPQYVMLPKKKEVIDRLKKEVTRARQVLLATDPDREGEAIAWHVAQILRETPNSKLQAPNSIARITFHEITKSAIEKALALSGQINLQLVDAQQARRVLDRLVGYKLSPLLWVKIRRGLSAGRVQSVAVRLVVDREREIEKFIKEEYWEIWAELRRHIGGLKEGVPSFLAQLVKKNGEAIKIAEKLSADVVSRELERANYEVYRVEKKEVFQNPPPPFTTSTLQQKAVQVFGFSGKRTMRAAQSLYEKGLITYHRTDSVILAFEAILAIRGYINKVYGENYLPEKPRLFKTKSKVAQEAHEAIRPTNVEFRMQNLELRDEERLYGLIWKRAIASQMKAAVYDQTKIEVQAAGQTNIYILVAEGRVIKFAGWLAAYGGIKNAEFRMQNKNADREESRLPELVKGDDLDLIKLDPQQKFTQPPPRYTEATLIKALEERGIGRPSTYAPIVSTIQDRQYVEKIEGKFKSTPLGEVVNDFLVEYFADVVDYQFTAKMEDELDDIANGKRQWQPVVADFYGPFAEKLEGVGKAAERVPVPVTATEQKCPQCQEGTVVIRTGRFGKFLSCSRFPQCKYTAAYVEKLEGVKCPKCGAEVVIKKSKKGKRFYGCANYPQCNWASWRKPR